ncbi:MAG: DUF3617 domain-containing protein [Steroidobacteraceae bacterium]
MRPKDWKFAGALLAGLALSLIATAAEPVKLNVKPGLWEIASQNQISGAPPISEDQLARLTPDQRARMEAAMQSSMADAAKPHLAKHCLTPEKIARGLDVDHHDDSHCQRKITNNSGNELALTESCQEDSGSMVLNESFQLAGPEAVSGTVHVVRSSGGKTMTIDSTIHGQWLGASCGDIKDFQIEK